MGQDINTVTLVGRLTRDAELKYTNAGTAVCKFGIAVNRRKKSGDQWTDEVSYFDIVLWGKRGESIQQYLTKGKQIAVDGELRQNRWTQDGQNRSKVEVNADNVQLLSGGSQSGGSQGGSSQGNRGNQGGYNSQRSGGPEEPPPYGGPEEFEDDIPF